MSRDNDAQLLGLMVVDVRRSGYAVDSSRGTAQPEDGGDLELLIDEEEVLKRQPDVSDSFEHFIAVMLVGLFDFELVSDVGNVETEFRSVGESVTQDEVGSEHEELRVAMLGSAWRYVGNGVVLAYPPRVAHKLRLGVVLHVDVQAEHALLDRPIVACLPSTGERRTRSAGSLGVGRRGESE